MKTGLHRAGSPALATSSDQAIAIAAVESVPPGDAAMEAHRAFLLGRLRSVDHLAHRATPGGHLTGSALVVDADGTRMLLLFHRKLRRWLQPGGHADGDTNLAAVALREAAEETGMDGLGVLLRPIDVDVHEVAPPGEQPHLHLDVRYLVVARAGAEPAPNEESEGCRWVRPAELDALGVDAGLVRLAQRGFDELAALRRRQA